MSQFVTRRPTATTAISPTWSINRTNTSGINSWYASLPGIYLLIWQCSFTYSCQWQYHLAEHMTFYHTGDLCLTQSECPTMKNKWGWYHFKFLSPFQVPCLKSKSKEWSWWLHEKSFKNTESPQVSLFRETCAKYIKLYISSLKKKNKKK